MGKQFAQPRTRLNTIQPGVIALLLLTAGAHFYLGTQMSEELHSWFLLNGLGYCVLLVSFLLPPFGAMHAIIRKLLLMYTMLTILLWIFFGGPAEGKLEPFDVIVKAVEVLLVILLLLDEKAALKARGTPKQVG
jgi:hypothetical protein